MKDTVQIKAQNGGTHFEIKRELSEVVNRSNLEDRLQSLRAEKEQLVEHLERIDKNIKLTEQALNEGKSKGSTETPGQNLI